MNFKTLHLILFFTLQPLIAGLVSASEQAPIMLAEAKQTGISEDEAAVIASKTSGGQVISSETSGTAGVTVYSFKVLMSDGRVKNVKVNAKTGEIL